MELLVPSILGEIGSDSVLSLFTKNKIEFDSSEDIKEVIRVGKNKENFKVVLDNGEQYIFDSDYRIIGIYKDNYSIFMIMMFVKHRKMLFEKSLDWMIVLRLILLLQLR